MNTGTSSKRRGVHKVYPCEEIVELPGGERYACARHTKNKDRRCSQHRPPTRKETPR